MENTAIQWCDDTVNPSMGCDGCEIWDECYAHQLTNRMQGRPGYPPSFEAVTLFPGRTRSAAQRRDLRGRARPGKPWLNGLPRLIFVSDMGDSLSKAVRFEYLEDQIVNQVTSEEGMHHQWLWLTKQPGRMVEFSAWLNGWGREWPRNLWAGTSVTTQGTSGRIDQLLKVGDEHTIRFLSVEPQRGPIDLTKWLPKLNWIIQGGESGKNAREFKVEWAYDLLAQCRTANVPYFLKQLGKRPTADGDVVSLDDGHGGDWREWPEDLRVREMPALTVPATNQNGQASRPAGKARDADEDVVIRKGFLTLAEQKEIYSRIMQIEPGFYVPELANGNRMNLKMNCLGHHWSVKTYECSKIRDIDGKEVAPVPDFLQAIIRRVRTETDYWHGPEEIPPYEFCIMELYQENNSESEESIGIAYPVISFSIGASAIFTMGPTRKDQDETHQLDSGDLVMFRGSKRLVYPGITRILRGTTPPELGFATPGRLSLTFAP